LSYGRSPYYIYACRSHNDNVVIEFIEPRGLISRGEWAYKPTDFKGEGADVAVSENAIAQLIAHIAARGTKELQAWIDHGASLNDPGATKGDKKWLKTKVSVKRGGKKI